MSSLPCSWSWLRRFGSQARPSIAAHNDQIAGREALFARENLVAWCIVPFDSKKRGPEDRAAMLAAAGVQAVRLRLAGRAHRDVRRRDRRAQEKGIRLDAFWVAPGELNRESRMILDLLKRHGMKTDLWVLLDIGADRVTGAEQKKRVAAAADKLRPLAEEAAQDRLLARLSTTTAAGSESRRTRSRSSSD